MNCIRLLRLTEKPYFNLFKITSPRSASRMVSHHPIRFMESQDIWRERDGLPKPWQLIYRAPMDTALNFATAYITCTTSLLGVGSIYYGAYVYDPADLDKPVIIGEDVIIASSPTECLVYLGAFLALHVAVKIILTRYIVRLYQNGDHYTAIYRGHWYNSICKHEFHLEEFKKLQPNSIIPWSHSTYSLGKKTAILLDYCFKTPEYYNYLINKVKRQEQEDDE